MKKARAFLKKHWIVIWLLTVLFSITLIVHAEYIADKNKVKKVAANIAAEGQLFSSNHLTPGDIELKKIQTPAENVYCVVPINIWNYNASNPTKAFQGEIPYTLTMKLVDSQDHTIAQGALNGLVIEFSTDGTSYSELSWNSTKGCYYYEIEETFEASNGNYIPSQHNYYVRFPSSVLDNDPGIYMELIASPDDNKNFSAINAIIGVQHQGTTIVRGWRGDFFDDKSYIDYDAFNYVVTGNGSATITLQWCSDYLEINEVNLAEYASDISSSDLTGQTKTINGVNGKWKKIVIDADADELDGSGNRIGRNRYGFQFYMTGNPADDYGYSSGATVYWQTVGSYVSFKAE